MSPLYFVVLCLTGFVVIMNVISLANPDWTGKSGYLLEFDRRAGSYREISVGYTFGPIEWCQIISGKVKGTECNRYGGHLAYDRAIEASFTELAGMKNWRESCLAMMVISIVAGLLCLLHLLCFWTVDRNMMLLLAFVFSLLAMICQLITIVVWAVKWEEFVPTLHLRKVMKDNLVNHYRPMFIITVVTCFLSLLTSLLILVVHARPECCVRKPKEKPIIHETPYYIHEIQ